MRQLLLFITVWKINFTQINRTNCRKKFFHKYLIVAELK